jgi:hypothetical protein
MMFLLYKPIICRGTVDTPVSISSRMLSVALTAQAHTGAERFNNLSPIRLTDFASRNHDHRCAMPHGHAFSAVYD